MSAMHARKRLRGDSLKGDKWTKESLPNLSEGSEGESSPPAKLENHGNPQTEREIFDFINSHDKTISKLFGPSVEAKIWGVAATCFDRPTPPVYFPEYTQPGGVKYVYRELDFWTSGFFPGSLYLLLERRRKFAHNGDLKSKSPRLHEIHLEYACKLWTENLHQNALLQNTHDIGFMIMPWARIAYELNRDVRALETIKTAARSLLSRFDKTVGCIRSWDTCVTKKYDFRNPESEYMVIIDNMMNLDLLFYAASKTNDDNMRAAATAHAHTTARTHLRPDGSTTHLIVFDPKTGSILQRLTNQGYAHNSCWARGQAWAIAGFAETYTWTQEVGFLDTARRCADYFLDRMRDSKTVPWDFDADRLEDLPQPPDTSAAMIAAYGMLLIHRVLFKMGERSRYLAAALSITEMVCSHHVNAKATFTVTRYVTQTAEHGETEDGRLKVNIGEGETILNGATINNYEFAPRKWANHGLVYADYYFLLVGNMLLDMGIIPTDVVNYEEKALTR